MPRLLFFLCIILLLSTSLSAQPKATDGKVDYGKGDKIAAMIELPYAPEVVEDAIEQYLAKKGVKGDKSRSFQIFRNLKLKDGDSEINDLHFKVERKSRREKDVSVVYLLIGKPGENVSVRTKSDNHKVDDAKEFLNDMTPFIEAHKLEKDISDQELVFGKAEKKMKTLADEQKELEEKLATNKTNQEKQVIELEKQKTVLEAMRTRRKN